MDKAVNISKEGNQEKLHQRLEWIHNLQNHLLGLGVIIGYIGILHTKIHNLNQIRSDILNEPREKWAFHKIIGEFGIIMGVAGSIGYFFTRNNAKKNKEKLSEFKSFPDAINIKKADDQLRIIDNEETYWRKEIKDSRHSHASGVNK